MSRERGWVRDKLSRLVRNGLNSKYIITTKLAIKTFVDLHSLNMMDSYLVILVLVINLEIDINKINSTAYIFTSRTIKKIIIILLVGKMD